MIIVSQNCTTLLSTYADTNATRRQTPNWAAPTNYHI